MVIAETAITNVRVFDGERLHEPATVVLEGATISARTSADGALNVAVVDDAVILAGRRLPAERSPMNLCRLSSAPMRG